MSGPGSQKQTYSQNDKQTKLSDARISQEEQKSVNAPAENRLNLTGEH